MMRILALAVAAALVSAPIAEAGGLRVTVGGGAKPPRHHARPHGPFIVDEGGLQVFGERRLRVVQDPAICWDGHGNWRCGGRPSAPWRGPNHHLYSPHSQRFVVGPRADCLVPGHWTYHWVPQTAWYNHWVPGHWSPDGTWIEGHYQQRPYTSGYYQQPVWVAERWAC
ncbi:MAG: hypothetical protein HYU41_26135 [Candidatus Rokubacteria bacterium]|nr:hypothetical protein [Candidatus Rokubacteria bacterium]